MLEIIMKARILLLLLLVPMVSCGKPMPQTERVKPTNELLAELKSAIMSAGETNGFQILQIDKRAEHGTTKWYVMARYDTYQKWGDGGPVYVMTHTNSLWHLVDKMSYDE